MKTPKQETFPLVISKGSASVTIYKIKAQPGRDNETFTLAYVAPTGRVRRNFADLVEAKREADSAVSKLAKGDLEALKLTGRDAQIFVAATEALQPCGVSLDIAAREFAQAFEILGFDGIIEAARHYQKAVAQGLPDIETAAAVDRFYATKVSEEMSPKYLKDIRLMLGALDSSRPQKERGGLAGTFHCLLKAISADQLQDYFTRLKVGKVTKDNHRRVIVAFFNWARGLKWLSQVEPTAADALGVSKAPKGAKAIYTPEEMAALLAGASERFVPWLALIAFGGVRHDEIRDDMTKPGEVAAQLKWEDIDFKRGEIVIPERISKVGKWRKIKMQPNLRAWLEPYKNRKGFIYEVEPETDMRNATEAASRILYGADPGAKTFTWKRNALRHSFGTYRWEVERDAVRVSEEMGNSPKVVKDNYRERTHAEVAEAYWNIMPAPTVTDGKIVPMSPELPVAVIDEDERDERELATTAAQ